MTRIAELNDEIKNLRSELEGEVSEERIAEIEKRQAEINVEMRKADLLENLVEMPEEEKKEEERGMSESEMFVQSGKVEMRAVLGSGLIAKPTKAAGINDIANELSGIVDDVKAVALTGNGAYVVAYKTADAIAASVTDGSAIGGTGATFNYVTINPSEWGVFDEISNQVKKLTPVDYETAVKNSSLIALRAEAESKIIAAVQASALAEQVSNLSLDADYLRTLVLGFKAIAGKGVTKLYINQADLITLGKVRGTNEKRPLYTIAFDEGGKSGTISEGGLAVKFAICNDLTTGTQLFGQPMTIEMPMWDGYKIETNDGGEFFKKNVIGIRGIQTANADLCAYHGMQVVTN